MAVTRTRVAILGAGPAGLAAAWQLARQQKATAIVIEQRGEVGGNAGSFALDGVPVDYGSHRLHPSCHPGILQDLRTLLGDDLRDRTRHGRIYLRGRWVHFPLKPLDLLLHLPPSFIAGVTADVLRRRQPRGEDSINFATVLEQGLGATICRDFYFPYAQKIWGVAPDELSATQAYRRVSAGTLGRMARKVLGLVPGFATPGAGHFYYPRQGFGQLSSAIAAAVRGLGVNIHLRTTVCRVHLGTPHRIEVRRGDDTDWLEADHVWSTIPLPLLARSLAPPPPPGMLEAAQQIGYRSMVLIYLVLAQPQFTPFDAHYFPGLDIKLTRLSEPKNYSGTTEPRDRTALCGELPCSVDDPLWHATDAELGELARDALTRCGLPIRAPVLQVVTKRLAQAYPIYRRGYEHHFNVLDDWMDSFERVLTFGRQGLFAHDNTHHALAMGYAAADCLAPSGTFNRVRWHDYRRQFARHVVED